MAEWAVITGAGRGLGRELALKFASSGYNLFLHARDVEFLKSVKAEVQKFSIEVDLCTGDLRDREIVTSLLSRALSKNPAVVINNAGVPCPGLPLNELKEDYIESLFEVNLHTPIIMCKAFYEHFLKRKSGTIININSIVGIEAKKLRSVYSAVRFGLRGFTQALSMEAAEKGIRVFGVYPSRIKSKPEYEYGFETEDVANRIFDYMQSQKGDELVLDGRPK